MAPTAPTPVPSSAPSMHPSGHAADHGGRRSRGSNSWRQWQNRTTQTLTGLVSLVRQVKATSEARIGDAQASAKIASEETAATLQQIKNGMNHLNNGVKALTPQINTVEDNLQDSLKSLQTSTSDAVKGDTMAILQEVREIHMHLAAADFDGGSAARLLLEQRDQAENRANTLDAEKKIMFGELECSQLRLKEEQDRRKDMQAQLAQTVNQLQEKLKVKSGELKAAQESLLAEQNTNQPGKLSRGYKICDKAFQENWETMAYKIRALAHTLSKLKLSQHIDPDLEELAYEGEEYFKITKDGLTNRYIFQTLLWKVVDNDIFQGWSPAWESHPQQLLQSLKQKSMRSLLENADAAEKLGAWISDGTYYLAPEMDQTKPEPLQKLAAQASDKFIQILHPSERDRAGVPIKRDTSAIFSIALEVHRMMLSSRACFDTSWIEPGLRYNERLPFDPSIMECLASSGEPKYVLWALTPILWKAGNADGQYYDQNIVLEKAQVICE